MSHPGSWQMLTTNKSCEHEPQLFKLSSFVSVDVNQFLSLFCSPKTSKYSIVHQYRSKIGALANCSCYQTSETSQKGWECQNNGSRFYVSSLWCFWFLIWIIIGSFVENYVLYILDKMNTFGSNFECFLTEKKKNNFYFFKWLVVENLHLMPTVVTNCSLRY